MSAARVYIVLATCQGESWLPELLRSIQAQSYSDWTLLVRDDGSSDATRQILHDAAEAGPADRHRPGRWPAAGSGGKFFLAPSTGMAGRGRLCPAGRSRRRLACRQSRPASAGPTGSRIRRRAEVPRLVYCDAAVVDPARRPVHASFLRQNRLPYGSGRPLKTLLGRSFVLGCACAVNRSLLELALPLPEVVASHDWWLALARRGGRDYLS